MRSSSRSASTPRPKTPTTFQLVADDFTRIGAAIGALALPTLLVQEGGYELGVIGRNVVNVLRGVEGA